MWPITLFFYFSECKLVSSTVPGAGLVPAAHLGSPSSRSSPVVFVPLNSDSPRLWAHLRGCGLY